MKKFLLIGFLCVLIFGFGAVGSLHALPLVGSHDFGTDPAAYGAAELQPIIDDWNTDNPTHLNNPLPPAADPFTEFFPPIGPPYFETYNITWTGDWTYLTAKYSTIIDLFYIAGIDGSIGIDWGGDDGGNTTNQALSNWRLWNPVSVHEPATMLLLGSGLIGLGVLGRKRLFKKS